MKIGRLLMYYILSIGICSCHSATKNIAPAVSIDRITKSVDDSSIVRKETTETDTREIENQALISKRDTTFGNYSLQLEMRQLKTRVDTKNHVNENR